MRNIHLARNYARALYVVAEEAGAVDAVERDFGQLVEAFGNSMLDEIWDHPKVSKAEKTALADEVMVGAHPFLVNLAHLAIERNRVNYLTDVYDEFLKVRDMESHILHVVVESALEVSKAVLEKIAKEIGDLSDSPVRVSVVEKPDLIGGIRLKIRDNIVDGSVLARLDGLRRQLLETGTG